MITTYNLKNGIVIEYDDTTKLWTLKAGATLLSVKSSLSPTLDNLRRANATINNNGTATLNVDTSFKGISGLASFVQGGSTNGQTWLNRNCVSKPNQTTTNTQQQNIAPNNQNNDSVQSLTEAIQLWKDIQASVLDFGIEELDTRTMNTICYVKNPGDFIKNQLALLGVDDDLVKTAEKKFTQPEWKTMFKKLASIKPKGETNHRLEIFFGKPGTGKTYQAEKEYPNAVKISGKPNFDADLLFFRFNGKTCKNDIPTEITEAMINGQPIIIDEGNLFSNEVWTRLQPVLDNSTSLKDFGNVIQIKDGFKIIVTMNLKTNVGRFVLPAPIVSRASRIENFDDVKVERLVKIAWGF